MPSPDPFLTLWAMLAVPGCLLYGELVEDEHRFQTSFSPMEDRAKCLWMLRHPRMRISPAPRTDRHAYHSARVNEVGCLWARVESGESIKRLREFMPRPTLVLSETKVRATALWALSMPVECEKAHRANRSIARRLDCPRKHGNPETFLFDSTAKAWCNVDGLYTGGEIVRVARLEPPPDPNAWRERAAA